MQATRMERDYPFGRFLLPSLVRLVLSYEYTEKEGMMNKGQRSSTKRKGAPGSRRLCTTRSRISRADMAALEQLLRR